MKYYGCVCQIYVNLMVPLLSFSFYGFHLTFFNVMTCKLDFLFLTHFLMGAGSDAILLGAETLRGLYPVETISIVGKICAEVYLFFEVSFIILLRKVILFLNLSFELMQIEIIDLIVPFSELNSEILHLESFGFCLINFRSIYFLVLILYSLCLDLDGDVDFASFI